MRSLSKGPSKLIALSFTPFDKFPPSDDTRYVSHDEALSPFYVYLGFKADVRISPRTRLLRSIDQLASSLPTRGADPRVQKTFEAIGYEPIINLHYEVNIERYRSAEMSLELPKLDSFIDGSLAPLMSMIAASRRIWFRHDCSDHDGWGSACQF